MSAKRWPLVTIVDSICNVNISCCPVVAWWQSWHEGDQRWPHSPGLLTLPHLQSRNLGSNEQHSQIVILTVEDSYLVVSSPACHGSFNDFFIGQCLFSGLGPAYLKTINIRPICFVSLQLLIKYLPQFQGHFSSHSASIAPLGLVPGIQNNKVSLFSSLLPPVCCFKLGGSNISQLTRATY